ncbi:YceI family protein [Deinococcus maricopensis]|uniref:YceI family protein n=1 Tax=Deinococcus maricopensis (strain DSM 21211 / LMG 22137 / NRRL B-23946 / LB-34) TaxID=709986 RepID=E8U385_DEIML|nr:YceI family protein [Deinococcus maricopensis]ADV66030.1 YceI family protein [Deinococcus maricopensis DSM 21211]
MRTFLLPLSLLILSSASAAPSTFTVVGGKEDLTLMTVESETSVENFTGRTSNVTGTVTFDPATRTGRGTIIVNGASIRTGMALRDEHMRSAGWLNFDKVPTLRFQTTSVKHVSGDAYEVRGNLTLNGVTRPVTTRATVKLTPANAATKAAGLKGDALAITTAFPVKLSDFGVKNASIDGGRVNNTLQVALKFIASN